MSIVSAIIAEMNNKTKENWVEALEEAYEERDWKKVSKIIERLKKFYFSE